jgi:hypothetical protein
MKKLIYLFIAGLGFAKPASAQLIPSFNFGLKAGVNLSTFSTESALKSDNRAGYLAGVYARVGAYKWQFQPELYFNSKNVRFQNGGLENTAKFNSIDLPLLIGRKFGAFGVGGRINTGPVVSFAVSHDQSVGDAFSNASRLRVQDQNYAWQFGAGVDLQKVSIDLRYELGLSKLTNGDQSADIRANMFNLSLSYRLFAL